MTTKTTRQIRDALTMTKEDYLRQIDKFAEHYAVYKIFSKPKAKFFK